MSFHVFQLRDVYFIHLEPRVTLFPLDMSRGCVVCVHPFGTVASAHSHCSIGNTLSVVLSWFWVGFTDPPDHEVIQKIKHFDQNASQGMDRSHSSSANGHYRSGQ